MKKKLLFIFLFSIFLFPSQVIAHSIGQMPYFKVNGVYSDFYPVPATSLTDFKLPQDIAPGVFLVNQDISFEIDTQALPIPEQILAKTKFIWEFGDGTKAEGLSNTHEYEKPGTYYLDVSADSGDGFAPQLLQSTAINIVPNKDYILPRPVIEINGKQAQDPLLDIIDVNFSSDIKFDASKSEPGSSEIISYIWDMGDQNGKQGVSFNHKYTENPYTVFPVLRVRTKDGFVVDSFVQIKDDNTFGQNLPKTELPGMDWRMLVGAFIISIVAAGILTWLIAKFVLKKKSKKG